MVKNLALLIGVTVFCGCMVPHSHTTAHRLRIAGSEEYIAPSHFPPWIRIQALENNLGNEDYATDRMDEVLRSLNKRKSTFLDIVESDVRIYIESTGKQCIAVVERAPNGGAILKTWEVHLDDDLGDFCKVLYRFVRKRQYNGHDLDSALTEPISSQVENAYQEFYKSESEAISKGMLVMLAADELKLISFVDRITDIALDQFSSQVRKQVVHMVVHQVKQSVNQGTLHGVGHHIGHLAATTAGTQVATIVAHLLLKLLAANIGHMVAKLLASAFLKKLLAILIKKFVLAAVTAVVLQFLATHVGIAAGGSTIMWIVMPLLMAYIGYKVATFPKKLGEKVSRKIREELESRFEPTNRTILEKIFESVFGGNDLVREIAKDEEFQNMLRCLGEKMEGRKYLQVTGKSQSIVRTTVAGVDAEG